MNTNEINPHIRYARTYKLFNIPQWVSVCYDCRVFYITNASGSVQIDSKTVELLGNVAIYLPPKTKYKFNLALDGAVDITVLDFDLVNDYSYIKNSLGTATLSTYVEELAPEYDLPNPFSRPIVKNTESIHQILSECVKSYLYGEGYYLEVASAYLKLALFDLLKPKREFSETSRLCKRVIAYIAENYTNSSLTNTDISRAFNYNPYHLSNIMKKQTGKSLHKYLISYRLDKAKDYLLNTQLDIDDISWKTGFCTSAYFIKIFRDNVGMTPKKYRDTNLI